MKEQFEGILGQVKREGIDNLIKYLRESSFYKDPYQAFGIGAYKGGLAEYSFQVYEMLSKLKTVFPELDQLEDSVKIIGLLHSVNKIGIYQEIVKSVPSRKNGKIVLNEESKITWINQKTYTPNYENILPYPPNYISSIILRKYIKLTPAEELAFIWQNGIEDVIVDYHNIYKKAQDTHRLISLIYMAKIEARKNVKKGGIDG